MSNVTAQADTAVLHENDTGNSSYEPAAVITMDDVMASVGAQIATVGVGKDGKNTQQNYAYRKLDDVFDRLGPIMAKNGVAMTVRFIDHKSEWRTSKSGADVEFVTVTGIFTYRWKGQERVTQTIGKAQDFADKATNKAMAAATKYAHTLTFNIPIIGSDDADAFGTETVAAQQKLAKERATPPAMEMASPSKLDVESLTIEDVKKEIDSKSTYDDIAAAVANGFALARHYNDKNLHAQFKEYAQARWAAVQARNVAEQLGAKR